jgi:hypothetical protein
MHLIDDGGDADDGFFEWALAHFQQNPVAFSDLPADSVPDDFENTVMRRRRLARLN